MSNRITQEKWVIERLKQNGKVTRNEALASYISRLGAIICDLKKDGWDIQGYWIKTAHGKDYAYTINKVPTKKVSVVNIINGVAVESFIEKPI